MKKQDLPQDPSVLDKFTRDLAYVTDEKGNYTTDKSRGWEVKAKALDVAWEDIDHRVKDAIVKVKSGEASPLLYYMELKLMDAGILAAYTGFWKWTINRHLKPAVFKKLSEKTLEKYAALFEININQLKNPF